MWHEFCNSSGGPVVSEAKMKDALSPYPGQFDRSPDVLFVAIPRVEIISEMARRGDERALNDVCLAVAIVAEAMNAAFLATRTS
jgi:hypothetical protein